MTSQDKPAADAPLDASSSAAETATAPPVEPASDAAALLEKAKTEAAQMKDAWLRARADVENVRKQAANDLARAHKYANERFAGDLLAVRDALESTLAAKDAAPDALRDGVELTLKQLVAAFEKAQIVEIDPAGQRFDPHQHMAMTTVDTPEAPNTVVQVFQKGYRLQDRVLRPALVSVAKPPEPNP
jgi:molecular chaperone GrpE